MHLQKIINENIIKFAAGIIAIYFLIITISIVSGFLKDFNWLFTSIVFGGIIALIIKPTRDSLSTIGLPTWLSTILSYFVFFAVIIIIFFILLPPLVEELNRFLGPGISEIRKNFPSLDPINNFLKQFNSSASISVDDITSPLTQNVSGLVSNLGGLATNIIAIIVQFVLALVFSIFILSDGKKLSRYLFNATPKAFKDDYVIVNRALIDGFKSFIKIQGLSALSYSILVMLIMKVLNFDYILLTGVFSFIVFLIPGIGGPISLIPLILLGFVSKGSNPLEVLLLVIVVFAVQNILLNYLMPKFYGQRFGIHPALVLIVILVSWQLFGILGVILAIPVASAIQQLIGNYFDNKKMQKPSL